MRTTFYSCLSPKQFTQSLSPIKQIIWITRKTTLTFYLYSLHVKHYHKHRMCINSLILFSPLYEVKSIIRVLQIRKLRQTEIGLLLQGHRHGRWQSREWNPGNMAADFTILTTAPTVALIWERGNFHFREFPTKRKWAMPGRQVACCTFPSPFNSTQRNQAPSKCPMGAYRMKKHSPDTSGRKRGCQRSSRK